MNSEKQIDCQGLPCPQPVLKCKEVIEQENPLQLRVLVDNDPALENVSRFLSLHGYHLHKPEKKGEEWHILASKESGSVGNEDQQKYNIEKNDQVLERILIFISSDKIGQGDDELGTKLMLNFLSTLPEMESLWTVVFVNSGVKLTIEESPALESIQKLENNNVTILVCGTCLEFFGITDQKRTGQTTNMLDIITGMNLSDKVISM